MKISQSKPLWTRTLTCMILSAELGIVSSKSQTAQSSVPTVTTWLRSKVTRMSSLKWPLSGGMSILASLPMVSSSKLSKNHKNKATSITLFLTSTYQSHYCSDNSESPFSPQTKRPSTTRPLRCLPRLSSPNPTSLKDSSLTSITTTLGLKYWSKLWKIARTTFRSRGEMSLWESTRVFLWRWHLPMVLRIRLLSL